MRALLTLVVVMGVLIVAGVVGLLVTILHRVAGPAAAVETVLHEPVGTHMQSVTSVGDRLAVVLSGGTADRLVMIDARSGKVVGRVALAP